MPSGDDSSETPNGNDLNLDHQQDRNLSLIVLAFRTTLFGTKCWLTKIKNTRNWYTAELFLETSIEDCIKIINMEDPTIGDSPTINLVYPFEKICFAEINTIQAKLEEIKSWYHYRKFFWKKAREYFT